MVTQSTSLKVRANLTVLADIRGFIDEAAEAAGLTSQAASELRLAVDEACANIVIHGYKNKGGDLEITVTHDSERLTVTLSDHAPPYDPLKEAPGPDFDAPLAERAPGGLGVILVKQNTDAVEYRMSDAGRNLLILTKFCSPSPTGSEN